MAKIETRASGQIATGFALSELARRESEDGGRFHVLNSGKAYGGDVKLRGVVKIRTNPNRSGELIMLGDHDRRTILGAWTGARVEGDSVVAEDMRWTSPEVEPQVTRYRGLVDDGLLWGTSIGFRGRWYYVDELPDSDPDKKCGASWIIEGTEDNPIEVFEASLVTVGADADSMITYALADTPVTPVVAGFEMDDEDERKVEGIAGALMLAHLVEHHSMASDEAEKRVRAMLEGDAEVSEDDAESDDDGDHTEMADDTSDEDGAFFDVPDTIRDAAKRGLDLAEEWGRADDGPGVATARALSSGRVGPEVVIDMANWWPRFIDQTPAEESDGGPSALEIRWEQWGGKPEGAEWAERNEEAAREEVDGDSGDTSDDEDAMADEPDTPTDVAEPLTLMQFAQASRPRQNGPTVLLSNMFRKKSP